MKKIKILLISVTIFVLLFTFTFMGCDNNKKEEEKPDVPEIPSHVEHDYILHDAISATYENDGCAEYYSCSECELLFDSEKNEISEIPVTKAQSIFSKKRKSYKNLTNDQFANFRELVGGEVGNQIIFRSSSPINSFISRNTYADYATRTYGVNYIVNLCDSKAVAEAYKGYDKTYYSKQNVKYVEMPKTVTDNGYKTAIGNTIKYIADNQGIYLIHDDYGSMRTGIVSALLEVFMGANADVAYADFLLSYSQYYGMKEDDELAPLYINEYNDTIKELVGDDFNKENVANFFKSVGLDDSDLEKLYTNLSRDTDNIRINNFLDLQEAFVFGRDIEITYKEGDEEIAQAKLAAIKGYVEAEEIEWSELSTYFDELDDLIYEIYDQKRTIDIYSAMYADQNYYELSNIIMEVFNKAIDEYEEIEIMIADTKYRNDYYEGMSEEEIDEYVASIDVDANKAATALSAEMNDIQLQYQKKELKPEKALLLYREKANEYAALYGYDNYFAYAYSEIYGRHYNYNEGLAIEEYIKEYMIPLNNMINDVFEAYLDSNRTEFISYAYDFFGYRMPLIKDYVKFIGGSYEENFDNLISSGNYFISNIQNSDETAYQSSFADGTPFMFFGKDYQGLMTFIHEFGHYNADFNNTIKEYDLFEVQSQGDESLLAAYMIHNGYEDAGFKALMSYQLINLASSVVTGYLINRLENYLYTTDGLQEGALSKYWAQLCDEVGAKSYKKGYDQYWQYAAIQAPGYYMSYATSAMAALQILAIGINDLDAARECYIKTYDYPEELGSFAEILEYAGLYSPFVEDGYELIATVITDYLN